MASESIYISIDDISTSKPSKGPRDINLREGADVFQRDASGNLIPTRRVSGGGTRRNTAQEQRAAEERNRQLIEAQRLEQQRLQQEALKKEQERQNQLRKEREQQAFSGSIAGQLNNQPQDTSLRVDVYDPSTRFTQKGYRRSFGESARAATGMLIKDLSPFSGGGPTLQSPNRYTDLFKYSEGFKSEEVAYVNPLFGTVITDPTTGKQKTGEVTFGDIQGGIEEKRFIETSKAKSEAQGRIDVLTGDLQNQINRGDISVKEAEDIATEKAGEINKDFVSSQEKIFGSNPDVPGVFERTGKARRAAGIIPDVAAIGVSAGVGVINPVAGAGIATAYFVGKGVSQVSAKATPEEIALQGGIFAGVGKNDKGRIEILEPTRLDIEYQNIRKEAASNLLFGASSGIGLSIRTAESITQTTLKEGLSSRTSTIIYPKTYLRGRGSEGVKFETFIASDTRQSVGGFRSRTLQENPITSISDDVTRLGVGKGKAEFRSADFLKQIRNEKDPFIRGSQDFSSAGFARSGPINKFRASGENVLIFDPQKSKVVLGEGFVDVGNTRQSFTFGGFNERIFGDISKTSGGKATKLIKEKQIIPIVNERGDLLNLISVTKRNVVRIPFRDVSIIKDVKPSLQVSSAVQDIDKGFSSFRGGGKGTLSKQTNEIINNLANTNTLSSFGGATSRTALKNIGPKEVLRVRPNVFTSSEFAGTGQYELTDPLGGTQLLSRPNVKFKSPAVDDNIFINLQGPSINSPQISERRSRGLDIIQTPIPRLQPNISSDVSPRNLFRQGTKQRTLQQQILNEPSIPNLNPFGRYNRPGIPGFGLGLPELPKGSFSEGIGKRYGQSLLPKTRYQPSLTGAFFNIRGTGVAPGGLSVRGILGGSPTKKGKIKKKNRRVPLLPTISF